jgi:cholesterol oxidase
VDAVPDYDYVIVGSGFGGSVAALRLAEKGYRVLVVEKGRRFRPRDYARTNWNLPKWFWAPSVGFRGPFQMRFLRHITVVAGVGVGGGSLVYANTLPTPTREFFESGSWAGLADWERDLAPHYETALRMLGASRNARLEPGDEALRAVARGMGREDAFGPNRVAVFQGEPGRTVPDPYFGGEGPTRTGCVRCGACMIGCRFNAKNTLDKNYLWLAERRGARILADTEVTAVRARREGGYRVEARTDRGPSRGRRRAFHARGVVLAGGVLGTLELLLRMKEERDGLPRLSDALGRMVRTNSESLIGVTTRDGRRDLSRGIAIGSILHTDAHSHVEPVRYPRGSGFFRSMVLPHAPGAAIGERLREMARRFAAAPARHLAALLTSDWARSTQILLFMQTLDGTLRFRLGRDLASGFRRSLVSEHDAGEAPRSFIPVATAVADRFADEIDGVPMSLATEVLFGAPTTAHILGGACIGKDAEHGVIDRDQRVFGYDDLYVVDGSAVSANPGVNPSLSITAMAERAMSKIPART